jgi:hypothetical protein
MKPGLRQKLYAHRRDALVALAIFAATLTTFLISRVHQLADSKYSMMVSQSLLDHGTFALNEYSLPQLERVDRGDYVLNGNIYQLEWVGDRLYYYSPPGGLVLSVPYVALMNLFGVSAVNSDGTYNIEGDLRIQVSLAALLMAALATIFYFTSRVLLPVGLSVIIALGGAWGTQVWSTASRALWSDTWGIFLLGIVVWMLVAAETGKHHIRPVLLATLLAWMYLVRPTYAIPVVAITVYIFLYHRRVAPWYVATGMVWLAGFVAYSWHNFGHLLPNYYLASRLTFGHFWEALAGNLISPARGLLVYVPVLFFVAYALVRYRKHVTQRRLAVMALFVIIVHWIVTSGFPHWYGGHSYGPRLMTGIVPWLVLLGILGVQALLRASEERETEGLSAKWKLQYAMGGVLLLMSMTINALGATTHATALWNIRPVDIDQQPSRIWDWRHPQFLAKWQ